MIEFLLGQDVVKIHDLSPTMTVLQYLRQERGMTGSKEGCASGDCGACTVVLGQLNQGEIEYQTANACLLLLANLNHKQLITVEMLKQGQVLHPVQQALADHHGSQCGYCTPGFVMSMFALAKNKPNASQTDVMTALAGNLCRCTGYRPIVDAALSVAKDPNAQKDQFMQQQAQTLEQLQRWQQSMTDCDELTVMTGKTGEQAFLPQNKPQLLKALSMTPNARLVAGGTDFALEITQQPISAQAFLNKAPLPTLIHLHQVKEMQHIEETPSELILGANLPLSQCQPVLAKFFPAFDELLERFASLQIRNQGTLGGNIANASPIGDSPPLLIALNAKLILTSVKGSRTLRVEDYFLDYKKTALESGEFIEKIVIPKLGQQLTPEQSEVFNAYKVSKRIDDDISAVCGAFYLKLDGKTVQEARLGFGGMAAIAKRAQHAEAALVGQVFDLETVTKAMTAMDLDFNPLSDFRASASYRMQVAQNLLKRLYLEHKNKAEANPISLQVTHHV